MSVPDARAGTTDADHLAALVYELLDAHLDTLTLAGGRPGSQRWYAHLDYLRDLQRVGREALARTSGVAS
jgi:hypothetical protein